MFKHVRRKGGADSFDVKNLNKRIYVCELHFKDKDLRLLRVEEKESHAQENSFNIPKTTSKQKATRPPPRNQLI